MDLEGGQYDSDGYYRTAEEYDDLKLEENEQALDEETKETDA